MSAVLAERRVLSLHYHITVWEERDRLHIALYDQNGKLHSEWWDDDARSMFEDGFFVAGSQLENSVIDYAEYCGIIGIHAK